MAKHDEAYGFGPISDWKSTMPVWAHMKLWELQDEGTRWDLGYRPSGPIIGGWAVTMPSKVLAGILVPPVRLYTVRVQLANGDTQDLCLYPDDDYARWYGETEEERAAASWPTDDVITGWPDHYIVNGDPGSCGCSTHSVGLANSNEEEV